MDENVEMLEYMYQDSSMACYTLTKLIEDLKEKDNKITKDIYDIHKEYECYSNQFSKQIKKENASTKENSFVTKMMANMSIKKEVMTDNSDGAIADMLIKGISMGTIDMEKKITKYKDTLDKKVLKEAEEFLEFQQQTIEKLKKHL